MYQQEKVSKLERLERRLEPLRLWIAGAKGSKGVVGAVGREEAIGEARTVFMRLLVDMGERAFLNEADEDRTPCLYTRTDATAGQIGHLLKKMLINGALRNVNNSEKDFSVFRDFNPSISSLFFDEVISKRSSVFAPSLPHRRIFHSVPEPKSSAKHLLTSLNALACILCR